MTMLNRFHTCQGPLHACLHKWCLVTSELCDWSHQQPMNHTVDMCPSTKFDSRLTRLWWRSQLNNIWWRQHSWNEFSRLYYTLWDWFLAS